MFIEETLYREIIKVFPIPCVDLMIENENGELLLLKRRNNPAKGFWWFPGGRVLKDESRKLAAERKLKEECGITAYHSIEEVGTYDLLLEMPGGEVSHGITTVFRIKISCQEIQLDSQSESFEWKNVNLIDSKNYHDFIVNLSKL
jgi:colanic acid biosynthesis protein WcaH